MWSGGAANSNGIQLVDDVDAVRFDVDLLSVGKPVHYPRCETAVHYRIITVRTALSQLTVILLTLCAVTRFFIGYISCAAFASFFLCFDPQEF